MEDPYSLYKSLLVDVLKFKSISTDKTFLPEILKTVDWYKTIFSKNGFSVDVVENFGNPIIIAKYTVEKKLPRILVYGHYDVQPAERNEGWDSDPFELTEQDGKLFGRGVVDNKGQSLVHIAAVLQLIAKKELRSNVTFLLEGDEETGSPLMEEFMKTHQKDLKGDAALISDGEIIRNTPIMDAGFRGGFNATLSIRTSTTDLHSGVYGGVAPNAVHLLTKFLNDLYNLDLTIAIKGFYDDVDVVSDEMRSNNKSIPFDKQEFKKVAGIKELVFEKDYDPYTLVGLRPSIQVTGIKSGYTDEGYRNSIPSVATAKINFRLVQSQNPLSIVELFKDHVKNSLPSFAKYDLEFSEPYEGIKLDLTSNYILKAKQIIEEVHGNACYFKFSGGGLPIVTYFSEMLDIPCVMVPLGNEDCAMHAANENFSIDLIKKGLEFSKEFFKQKGG